MTEPEGTTAVAAEEAPVYFGSDGSLTEGWQGTLDETLREEKSLSTFKTVGDLAKSFVNTKSMVGKNTMVVPGDTSTEAEWEAYHVIGGRPDTVADYNLKAPDDFPEEVRDMIFPKGRLEIWQDRFFKAGISKKASEQFISNFAMDMLADYQGQQQVKEMERTELVSGLSVEWGAAYDQKKHLGNMAIEEGCSAMKNGKMEVDLDFKGRIAKKFGSDPDFIRFASNLGSKFAEGKSPNFSAVPTNTDYKEQIRKIESNPLYLKGTLEERMRLADQVMAIRNKMVQA